MNTNPASRLAAAAALLLCGAAAWAADFPVALNFNWNGLAHPGEGGMPDAPAGFRTISDRALSIDGGSNSLGSTPIVGATGTRYSIGTAAGVLDIVHLGNTGPGTARNWDAAPDADTLGVQPSWLPDTAAHTGPQTTLLSTPLTLDANSSIGVLYFVSNSGGNFDVVLGFTDSSTATVTLKGADWFGPTNPPASGPGVAAQTRLGGTTFQAVNGGDQAVVQTWPTQALSVTEGVITAQSLHLAGLGEVAGKSLASITFSNPTQPTRGYAIMAATVVTGLGPPANDLCANATAIAPGLTMSGNLRATGAATSPCGVGDTADVWYRYQSPTATRLEASTCGAAFDTTLSVYAGCGGAAVACNDNGCALASRVQWQAQAGQTYLIRVAGTNAATGQFGLLLSTGAVTHTDAQATLAYNWNGLVHAGENGRPDAPNGFRAIIDRGLFIDGAPGSLDAGVTIGDGFIPYRIVAQADTLDVVHLGTRGFNTVAGDFIGSQPAWLPSGANQPGPERTDLASLNAFMAPATRIGLIYQVAGGGSATGGTFDATLEFSDGGTATVTLHGPDWYLDQSPDAPGAGVELQHQLGLFNATRDTDAATLGAPSLNVVEAVISTGSLIAAGLGDPSNRRIVGISFSNRAPASIGVAVIALTLRDALPPTGPVAPTGSGSALPSPVEAGRNVLLRVGVAPGLNPASTGLAVVANLATVGGSTAQTFYDDGTHGDAAAGDSVFSFATALPSGQAAGAYPLSFTVTDAQSRTAAGAFTLNVIPMAWSEQTDGLGDAGDLPGTAQAVAGPSTMAVGAIRGVLDAGDADLYKITICDPATFSATTVGGAAFDTQLFLFDAGGLGIAANDDETAGPSTQSRITDQFVAALPAGVYYLAVSQYNKDPRTAAGDLIFNNDFRVEHAADGPGAAAPVAGWDATAAAGGAYTITLTGACAATTGGNPCPADFDRSGEVNANDISAYLNAWYNDIVNGTVVADFNADGETNANDISAYINAWYAAIVNGGAC